jgi:endonuclease/exonuclease/phosphatase family metal-dependent hydrolase
MRFTIVSWNLGHAFGARRATHDAQIDFLRAEITPDVALLQEVDSPRFSNVIAHPEGLGRGGGWGSAVVSDSHPLRELTHVRTPYSKSETPIIGTIPGSVAVAQMELATADPVVIASIYGAFDYGYSITTVHRQLSDLASLLDSSFGKRVILGGDFNCSTQLDPPHRERHKNLFERFQTLGLLNLFELTRETRKPLENCWCDEAPQCPHVQTHRHARSKRPWHNDYLFATRELAGRLVDCYAVDEGDPDPWTFSDHCPVVAVFDL